MGEGYIELIVNCKRCAATGTDYVCGNEDCRIPPIPHTAKSDTHRHTHMHTQHNSFVLGWSPHCNRQIPPHPLSSAQSFRPGRVNNKLTSSLVLYDTVLPLFQQPYVCVRESGKKRATSTMLLMRPEAEEQNAGQQVDIGCHTHTCTHTHTQTERERQLSCGGGEGAP